MRFSNRRFHRAASALSVAAVLLLIAGGASASDAPRDVAATAHAEALRVSLTLPTSDYLGDVAASLCAAAKDSSCDIPDVPDGLFKGQTIEIVIAQNDARITQKGAEGFAETYRISSSGTVQQTLGQTLTSACRAGKDAVCKGTEGGKSCVAPTASPSRCGLNIPIQISDNEGKKYDLGSVEVFGAYSEAPNSKTIRNETAIVQLHLDLRPILALPQVKPVTDAINDAIGNINSQIVPKVNELVDPKDYDAIEVGHLKDLPTIDSAPLLDVTVLPGQAINDVSGNELRAQSAASIVGLKVLGGWISLGKVNAASEAIGDQRFLNVQGDFDQTKIIKTFKTNPSAGIALARRQLRDLKRSYAQAKAAIPARASAGMTTDGLNVAGLLKADVIGKLRSLSSLEDLVRRNVPATAVGEELIAAARLVDRVTGASFATLEGDEGTVKRFGELPDDLHVKVNKGIYTLTADSTEAFGYAAGARSERMVLNVAPAVPLLRTSNAPQQNAVVPRLGDDDFLASGVSLRVAMPYAESSVGKGVDVGPLVIGRTGVGTHWIVAMLLIGAAVLVRRFGLAK